jgi:hypothetical protein
MTLGEKVKLKREELNLSQEELAEKMNYKSKTSIHKIEVGITDLPLSKVKELAAVLKTTPAYLMGWEEDKSDVDLDKSDDFKMVARDYNKLSEDKKKLFKSMMKNFMKSLNEDE